MQSGQRDYIRDVYRILTDIGEEADKTVDARFGAEQTTALKKTVTPAVKVTPPPRSGTVQQPPPLKVVPPARTQSAPSTQSTPAPTSLSVRNPFSVVGAAISAVMQRRLPAFWLGVFFVLAFALLSTVVIQSNVQADRVVERGPLMPIGLAVVTYFLCWWIRMGNNPHNTPFTGAIRFPDIVALAAIGLVAYVVLPALLNAVALPVWLRYAAKATLWWPLNGPYAAMVWPAVTSSAPAAPFWEPFLHAMLLIPAFPLIPFITRDPVKRWVKMAHLLVATPLLILALALCTLPIAFLTATVSPWALGLVNAHNAFAPSLAMAAIFYAQLVLSAATIGEFYRRVSLSHP